MWLALNGAPVSRRSAWRWFGVRASTWDGASHDEMARVVAERLPALAGRWQARRLWDLGPLAETAAVQFALGRPMLVTAQCEWLEPRLSCRHAFLLTGVHGSRLELLDPLGRRPGPGSLANAWIDTGATTGRWRPVQGARWRLDLAHRLWWFTPIGAPAAAMPLP